VVELPVDDEELSPADALENMDPDAEHFHEATGNEGASFERIYRRAAFVLWPRHRFFAILNQAGRRVTLPYLADLTERWAASEKGRQSPLWEQAHDLSGHMVSKWPTHPWYAHREKAPSKAARMLSLLTRLRDPSRIEALLVKITATGGYDKQNNDAIISALALLPLEKATAIIERLIAATAEKSPSACGALLAHAVAELADGRKAALAAAARGLVDALPGDLARPAVLEPWRRGPVVEPGLIVDLMTALEQIDQALAGHAADHILAWPKTYGPDTCSHPGGSGSGRVGLA
jgi:hypothetical protein